MSPPLIFQRYTNYINVFDMNYFFNTFNNVINFECGFTFNKFTFNTVGFISPIYQRNN